MTRRWRNCRQARRFAEGLDRAGAEVLNDVVLNQVVVAFGSDEQTREVIHRVQASGECWCGGTRWHDREAMRISVSCWRTTDADVERSLAAEAGGTPALSAMTKNAIRDRQSRQIRTRRDFQAPKAFPAAVDALGAPERPPGRRGRFRRS